MIIQEIPFGNLEANQRITNLTLNNQIVTIQLNTIPDYSIQTHAIIGQTLTCSLWLANVLCVGNLIIIPKTNLNILVTPSLIKEKLTGYFFVYSPYTNRQPQYVDFGDKNIYKFFYTNYMDFTNINFVQLLKKYF